MELRRSAALNLAMVASLALLVPACGGKDSTAPPASSTLPRFDFSFNGVGVSHPFTFTQAGDWQYHCSIHGPDMKGEVKVRESSTRMTATITVAPGGTLTFSPDSVTVGVNGVVTWVSATSTAHTATRP